MPVAKPDENWVVYHPRGRLLAIRVWGCGYSNCVEGETICAINAVSLCTSVLLLDKWTLLFGMTKEDGIELFLGCGEHWRGATTQLSDTELPN